MDDDDERAQFERSISNLYGFGQLKLDQENIGRARRHYTVLEEQTDAFIAANPHLSSLQLQLLDANVRFKAPLYSAFRDLLWARYRKVRAHPYLGELVAACVRLGWWDKFSSLHCDLSARAWTDLSSACHSREQYKRMLELISNFVQACIPYQDAYWSMEEEAQARGFRRNDPERSRHRLWALNAMRLRPPFHDPPPPPYANEYDVLMH